MERRLSTHLRAFLVALIMVCSGVAQAFDLRDFKHTPPVLKGEASLDKEIQISIPANGLRRARLFVAQPSGYVVTPMNAAGPEFVAPLKFGKLAVIKYQFQIEASDGLIYETEFYTIRQPSSSDQEKRISALTTELESLNAKIHQLESSISGLKIADPRVLGKRKGQELAKALLLLSKKEREYAEISKK